MSSRRPIAATVRALLPALLALVAVLDVRDAGAAPQLTASWTDNSGGEAAFTIERRTASEATFTALADVAVGVTSYVDAAITPGVTYCYRVKAYNGSGESPYCDEACGSVASDYSITITSVGTGTGTVSSTPVGINCGSSCTATYAPGALVTLRATAASGSRFDGWSGACSGTAACTVTGNAAVTVRATFNRLPSVAVTPTPPPPTTTTSTATTPTVSTPAATTAIPVAVPTSIAMMPSTRSSAAVPSATRQALPSDDSGINVTVAKAGDGTGTVVSSPMGIECGGGGCPATFSQLPSKDARFDPDRPGMLPPSARAVIDARPARRTTAIPVQAAAPAAAPSGAVPTAARPWVSAVQSVTTDISAPYRLVVRVAKRTWVRVRMDNGQVTEEKLKAGAMRMWVSNRPFVISIGNAGGVRLELNGRRLPSPDGVPISDLMLPQ